MKIVINPKYEELRKFLLELPPVFGNLGEVTYQGRNQIRLIEYNGIKLNVKSFKVPNVVNRFVYGNLRKSKAERSFKYANALVDKNIDTPFPVAYIEERAFIVFKRSYYISIHEEFDGMMRELKWGKLEGREDLLKQFARFTASIHEKGVLHLDYSPGNILYKKQNDIFTFSLVDLNRMKFGEVSEDTGCRNLRRLWGNEEMLTYIAVEYAKARGFDEQRCVNSVLKYHQEFWRKFMKKHKDRSPYIG